MILSVVVSAIGCSGAVANSTVKYLAKERKSKAEKTESNPTETEKPERVRFDIDSKSTASDRHQISYFQPRTNITQGQSVPANDPLGLIPHEWPVEIAFHPNAIIAKSERLSDTEISILALIPSSVATPMGVQKFHCDSLANWETIEVHEEFPEQKNSQNRFYCIDASRPGMTLEIYTGYPTDEILREIIALDFILGIVGENPLFEKLTCNRIPENP